MEIRRTGTNSVNSINLDNNINAEIIHTSRPMPFDSTTTTINSYEVFMNESDSCGKYRLLLKVNPFCTNILFNSCTEIVMNEGGSDEDGVQTILDNGSRAYTPDCSDAYGKNTHISRVDMVNNTEYSREEIGYTYHPGYDIFDNHILRNKSYNTVNYIFNDSEDRDLFNTISDYSRLNTGEIIKITPRRLLTSSSNPFNTQQVNKHLYKVNDLYSFFELESVNENLREENGWYGFKNTNVIESVEVGNDKPMDINRVINSRGNCDFIDMYPDRTLFSFIPKYNPYRRREEYNWDVILTYPYRNTYNHNIVSNYRDENGSIVDPEYRVNGLLVASCQNVMGGNGSNVTLFRTFSKHGLNDRDSVMFSYLDPESNNSSDSVYQTLPNTYWVTRTGDINQNNKENFFYLSDYNFLNDLFSGRILETFYHSLGSVYTEEVDYEHTYGSAPNTIPNDDGGVILVYSYEVGGVGGTELPEVPVNADANSPSITVNGVNYMVVRTYYEVGDELNPPSVILRNKLSQMKFRVSRVYKGKKSDYYIRIFRKLPNWKYSREQLSDYISEHTNLMNEFTVRNACSGEGVNRHNILFNHSVTPMAFSNTIYNDAVTQYLFTDSIQTEHLKDNRGRPLSSFYVTVLKSNRGYREWYGLGTGRNISSDNIEYSHCFGKLLSGFNYLSLSGDSRLWAERNYLSDVGILTDKNIMGESLYGIPISANEWVDLPTEITLDNDEFVGDICEWNDYECIERVLEKVCYRFNTVQREYGSELLGDFNFTDHELTSDDYDMSGNGENWGGFNVTVYDNTYFQNMLTKPEGYFYNPHYEIPIKKFSTTINQGSHELLSIKKATPIQADGIFIRLETYGKHKLTSEDSVYLCNDASHLWYLNDVVYIDSPNSFVINVIPRNIEQAEGKPYVDWITTCNNINDGIWKVRVRNKSIPLYASNVGINMFLWRDVLLNTGSDSFDYPFANGHNYIEHIINFFLKRQDPYGYNGLYNVSAYDSNYPANGMFPDVEGTKPIQETMEVDNYIIPVDLC